MIRADDVVSVIEGMDLWDMWPVQERDGRTATFAGGSLWFSLAAPIVGDPVERHALARLRLLHRAEGQWRDLGWAAPEGVTPGSRDWSGSAIVDDGGSRITLFLTAAGRRGEKATSYEQRLFQMSAVLRGADDGMPSLGDWSTPFQMVRSDGNIYHPANQEQGAVGKIKAFRDPGYFKDPANGQTWILFAASGGRSASPFNGMIGAASAMNDDLQLWRLAPPLISADGLNNELERPHLVYRDGRYYLFWSTQRSVFDPSGPDGPTGLYGMVADHAAGPYRPLNGSGLIWCNPPDEPDQAYSWLVMSDLLVASFVDQWGTKGQPIAARSERAHFGGVPAPLRRLHLDGDTAW